jgi:hypothetical protein
MLFATFLAACGGSTFSPSPSAVGGAIPTSREPLHVGPLAHESVLYSFVGAPNAALPFGGLLAGKNGEFYGISNGGGTVGPSGFNSGTVYEISSRGQEKVLYDFQGGNDGAGSEAALVADRAGNLFGVTSFGGGSGACTNGCGTVFEMQPNGFGFTERVLYAFAGGQDGANPVGSLLLGKNGVLYGTTNVGGGGACNASSVPSGCGTVFSLTPSGSQYTEKVIYSFQGGSDGESPRATLTVDSSGNLYGPTLYGGKAKSACGKSDEGIASCGLIFEITRSGHEKILYKFDGGKHDGSNPRTALLRLANGSFVSLTLYGGPSNLGTAYVLTPTSGAYTERVVHFFAQTMDGVRPEDPDGLAEDASGNLYGSTVGSSISPCGCGVVFELTPNGSGYTERVLHAFEGAGDGVNPRSTPVFHNGVLYGTTYQGGTYCYGGSSYSCGTVYKVRP